MAWAQNGRSKAASGDNMDFFFFASLFSSSILDFTVLLLTGDQRNIHTHLMEACWDSFV